MNELIVRYDLNRFCWVCMEIDIDTGHIYEAGSGDTREGAVSNYFFWKHMSRC